MERPAFWDVRRCRVAGLALCLAWAFCAAPPISFEGTFWAGLDVGSQIALRLASVGLLPALIIPLAPKVTIEGRSFTLAAMVAIVLWLGGWLGYVTLGTQDPLVFRFIALFCNGGGLAYFLISWGLRFCLGEEDESELDFVTVIVLVGALIIGAYVVMSPVRDMFLAATPLMAGALLAVQIRREQSTPVSPWAIPEGYKQPSKSFARPLAGLALRTALSVALVGFVWCMFSMNSASAVIAPDMYLFGFGFFLAGVAIWLFVRFSPSIGFVAATRWVLPMMALGLLCNAGTSVHAIIAGCLLLSMAHATFEMLLRMQAVQFARQYPGRRVVAVSWGFIAIMSGAFLGPSLYLVVMDSGIVDSLHLALWMLAILVVVGSVLYAMPDRRLREGSGLGRVQADVVPDASASMTGGTEDGVFSVEQRAQQLTERFGLTAREREILTLLLEGRSRPYIRDTLYLSISTVDTHIRHIYAKAGVHNKQELIDLSQTEGL